MKIYVCGFLFSTDLKKVVLIEKQKPAWQAGLLNGVGGKVEDYDQSIRHAMWREFKEETGATTNLDDWRLFADWDIPKAEVQIVFLVARGDYEVKTMETEKVSWEDVKNLRGYRTINNVQWLIPAALHFLADPNFFIKIADSARENHV